MGHPLFEVVTALSPLNSRPLLLVDQHRLEVDGTPIKQFSVDLHQPPLPPVPSPSLPPQSQQQPPPPSRKRYPEKDIQKKKEKERKRYPEKEVSSKS